MKEKLHGPWLMLVGYSLFGIVPLLVRWVSEQGVPPSHSFFFRFLFSSILVVLLVLSQVQKFQTSKMGLLFWRGLFGSLGAFCWFAAMQFTSAGKGTLLSYTHSIWANIFALMFFKATLPHGFIKWFCLALVGLWFVVDPSWEGVNRGDIIALFGGLFGGAAVCLIKETRKTENSLTVFGSFSFFGLAFAILALSIPEIIIPGAGKSFGESIANVEILVVLIIMGVVSCLGQLIFTQAYASVSIALGTVLSLSVPVFASIGGWLFLGEVLSVHVLIGGVLILMSCAAVGMLEKRLIGPAAGELGSV